MRDKPGVQEIILEIGDAERMGDEALAEALLEALKKLEEAT